MKLLLLTIIIVAISVILLSFNIIFRKDGKFPDGEISRSKELRKNGIICAKEEEMRLWGKKRNKKNSCDDDACAGCSTSCFAQNK